MTTYLMTWNPEKFHWTDLPELVRKVRSGNSPETDWTSGNNRNLLPDDRFFLFRQGREPRGIIGSGWITSRHKMFPHWENPKVKMNGNLLRFDELLNPDAEQILTRDKLLDLKPKEFWGVGSSGIEIPEDVAAAIEKRWKKLLDR
jgi:5-methylcytosine-specific restriction protein A